MKYGSSGLIIQLFFFPFVKDFYKKNFPGESCSLYMKNVRLPLNKALPPVLK